MLSDFQAVVPSGFGERLRYGARIFNDVCGLLTGVDKEVVGVKIKEFYSVLRDLNGFAQEEFVKTHSKMAELEFENAELKRKCSSEATQPVSLGKNLSEEPREQSTASDRPGKTQQEEGMFRLNNKIFVQVFYFRILKSL